MNVITGLTGSVTLKTGYEQLVRQASLRYGGRLLPTNYFGNGWETAVKGLKSYSGTLLCFLAVGADGGNVCNPFAMVDETATFPLTLTFAPGCSIQSNVVIGNMQIVDVADDVATVTFDFVKSDQTAPTILWS